MHNVQRFDLQLQNFTSLSRFFHQILTCIVFYTFWCHKGASFYLLIYKFAKNLQSENYISEKIGLLGNTFSFFQFWLILTIDNFKYIDIRDSLICWPMFLRKKISCFKEFCMWNSLKNYTRIRLIIFRDEFGGRPQNFCNFIPPWQRLFILFIFRFSSEIEVCVFDCIWKIPRISWYFVNFCKIRKKYFIPWYTQNYYMDQNLAAVSLKTRVNTFFLKKLLFLKILGSFGAEYWDFRPSRPDWWGIAPFGQGSPQQIHLCLSYKS